MDDDRDTAAEDQGYRLPRESGCLTHPFPRSRLPRISEGSKHLRAGLIRLRLHDGTIRVLAEDYADPLIRMGRATVHENQMELPRQGGRDEQE
jgi:hypothetical protein